MSRYLRAAALAVVLGSTFAPRALQADTGVATTGVATTQDLANQIEALRQQIDALKAKADAQAATATVDSVLKDADARSVPPSLQTTSTDFTGGYKDGKFTLQSADGKFSLSPTVQIQVRNVTNIGDGVTG